MKLNEMALAFLAGVASVLVMYLEARFLPFEERLSQVASTGILQSGIGKLIDGNSIYCYYLLQKGYNHFISAAGPGHARTGKLA